MKKEFIYKEINPSDIVVNEKELALRLGEKNIFSLDLLVECEKLVREKMRPKYVCKLQNVTYPDIDTLDLGFGKIKSHALYRNLFPLKNCYILVVSLGHEIDRLIQATSLVSPSKGYVIDAFSSMFAESLCDLADKSISEGKGRPRFSPGYGDLSLDIQPKILEITNAQKLLNISLTKELLMHPLKSITAIVGIRE